MAMTEDLPVSEGEFVPAPTTRRFRRIVTSADESGRSVFAEDAAATHLQVVADADTFVSTTMWRTGATPVVNERQFSDGLGGKVGVAPPAAGSVFRILEIPPDTVWAHREGYRERMMHATPSIDYALVLSGEIWAVLDTEERVMVAGDVLIQRGTSHAWSNRSSEPAIVAFVLIGGTVLPA